MYLITMQLISFNTYKVARIIAEYIHLLSSEVLKPFLQTPLEDKLTGSTGAAVVGAIGIFKLIANKKNADTYLLAQRN